MSATLVVLAALILVGYALLGKLAADSWLVGLLWGAVVVLILAGLSLTIGWTF